MTRLNHLKNETAKDVMPNLRPRKRSPQRNVCPRHRDDVLFFWGFLWWWPLYFNNSYNLQQSVFPLLVMFKTAETSDADNLIESKMLPPPLPRKERPGRVRICIRWLKCIKEPNGRRIQQNTQNVSGSFLVRSAWLFPPTLSQQTTLILFSGNTSKRISEHHN